MWALALTAAALLLFHPLILLTLTLAVLGAGWGAGVGVQLARTLRTAAIVAVPIVLVNVLVSRDGLTVFARLGDLGPFGQGDLTVEAAIYGAVIALKVALLMLITTLASLTVDPDGLLRSLRRLSFRSALTASLSTRMIPLLAADSARIAEAQRTRPGGPPSGPRARVALLGAVVGGSLDRAMDVAATLELRGFAAARGRTRDHPGGPDQATAAAGTPIRRRMLRYAHPRRHHHHHHRRPWSRHDIAFACSAVAIIVLAILCVSVSAGSFRAYPLVHMPVNATTCVLCVALILATLSPFLDRRGTDP
jgi:energy-coupling factor transport system permease protein